MTRVRPYAHGTEVSVPTSQQEISRILARYGADAFGFGQDDAQRRAVVTFRASGRHVRFDLPLPDDRQGEWANRTAKQREAEVRRRWRALTMAIKAKLEVVHTGISTFEEEFLAHVVLPDGSTVGTAVVPRIQEAYETGQMPELLPGGGPQLPPGK